MADNARRKTQDAGILNELADLRTKMLRMEARTDKITTETRNLQSRVSLLSSLSDGYIRARLRFLDTYRRGNTPTETNSRQSAFVHQDDIYSVGDASTDAGLYLSHLRFDEDLFIEIYGMTAHQISRLGMFPWNFTRTVELIYLILRSS